jgi:hypothetical protein
VHVAIQTSLNGRLAGRYRAFAGAYFILLLVATAGIGLHDTHVLTDWVFGDWLINYEAGFVRRGLTGQLIWFAARASQLSPIYIAAILCMVCYVTIFYIVWILLANSSWRLWVLIGLASPALLGFSVAGRSGFHKEVLYFAGLAIFFVLLLRQYKDGILTTYLTVACVFCVLSHEALFLYLPYFAAALLVTLGDAKRTLKITIIPIILAAVSFYVVTKHPGTAAMSSRICASLGDQNVRACGGSMGYLANDSAFAHSQVLSDAAHYHYFSNLPPLALLTYLPIVMAFASLWRIARLRIALFHLGLVSLISCAMSFTLFYYATDWGRWIYIHAFSLFLILLFVDYRHQADSPAAFEPRLPARKSQLVLAAIFLFLYATSWDMPDYGDTPRFGYLGMVDRLAEPDSLTLTRPDQAPKPASAP